MCEAETAKIREPNWKAIYEKRKARNRLHRETLMTLSPHCHFCGKVLSITSVTLDHLRPRSKGGTLARNNLVLACSTCNAAKANRTPEEWAADILNGARRRIPEGCKYA